MLELMARRRSIQSPRTRKALNFNTPLGDGTANSQNIDSKSENSNGVDATPLHD